MCDCWSTSVSPLHEDTDDGTGQLHASLPHPGIRDESDVLTSSHRLQDSIGSFATSV